MNSQLVQWSEILAKWAAEKSAISEVWIFGSWAKACQRPDSDLDVAVIMSPGSKDQRYTNWFFANEDWEEELKKLLPVTVDLDIGDADISTKVVAPALKREGICVFSRHKETI